MVGKSTLLNLIAERLQPSVRAGYHRGNRVGGLFLSTDRWFG